MRVQIVDPAAYTPPYDHALSGALARAGAEVELITARFPYGAVPVEDGYRVRELFYRRGCLLEHGVAEEPNGVSRHRVIVVNGRS